MAETNFFAWTNRHNDVKSIGLRQWEPPVRVSYGTNTAKLIWWWLNAFRRIFCCKLWGTQWWVWAFRAIVYRWCQSLIKTPLRNKALWLDVSSHVTSFSQSEHRFILRKFAQVAKSHRSHDQCHQIGRFIALWETFSSFWQQLFFPKLPTFLGNFCIGVKIFDFSCEIIFGQLL